MLTGSVFLIRSVLISQVKLRTLDIGNNQIEEIEGVSHLTQLEEFWVSVMLACDTVGCSELKFQANNNQIPTLRALDSQLAHISTLETVYLEGNPCQKNDQGYRRKVILALPQVKQVDAT